MQHWVLAEPAQWPGTLKPFVLQVVVERQIPLPSWGVLVEAGGRGKAVEIVGDVFVWACFAKS